MKGDFVTILDHMGIAWKYLLNGLLGAFVWAVHKQMKFWEALRQIVVGGIVAGFATPVLVARTGIAFVGFVSFVTGMVGMVFIDILYKFLIKKIKLLF